MGGNRRNRGRSSSQNQHQNRSRDSASASPRTIQSNSAIRDPLLKNDVVLAEIEGGLNLSWKEIWYLGFALIVVLTYGVVVGGAAGTCVSIHWFEKSLSEGTDIGVLSSQRIRLLPNPSASHITPFHRSALRANKLLKNGLSGFNYDLETNFRPASVLPDTSFRTDQDLMLVEESVPLGDETMFSSAQSEIVCSENDSSDSCISDDSVPEQTDGSSPRLSTAHAKLFVPHYDEWIKRQPKFPPPDPMIKPTTCQDGSTGFDDWFRLRNAIHEANSISEERSALWSSYFASKGRHLSVFEDDMLYYEDEFIFRICPGETLHARWGPISVNAANLVLECKDCTVDVGGTHLAFGPRAKNTLVKGITFRGATASSMTFFHHGSDAIFEDCTWKGNAGVTTKNGGVADVNSTSTVKFYRCEVGHGKKKTWFGGSRTAVGSSSLSIRA